MPKKTSELRSEIEISEIQHKTQLWHKSNGIRVYWLVLYFSIDFSANEV